MVELPRYFSYVAVKLFAFKRKPLHARLESLPFCG